MKSIAALSFLVSLLAGSNAFTAPIARSAVDDFRLTKLSSAAVANVETESVPRSDLAKRDRYIATNRFAVRKDQQAKFEKRWATRKSQLATLPGFRYFHLMRRVQLQPDGTCVYDGGETEEEAQENYVSFTIWNRKSDFSAWRKGEAFKEAHGGTSIGAFLTTMIGSAFVLRGAPRPAFYDGLALTAVKPKETPETIDGWRQVDADGVNTLPVECFAAMEKLYIKSDMQAAFEKSYIQREAKLGEATGFVAFSLLRRDGQAKGHGVAEMGPNEPNYVGATVFKDRASYEKWNALHSDSPSPTTMWNKSPEKVFYEGTLVISSEEGP
ncbi:hypothetical protein MPSEU_001085400 [Mayamaea pseudoterrestris]|nr:hypothetical protein MPSEU_001085400 [Mayamaea pseudoterrestris]